MSNSSREPRFIVAIAIAITAIVTIAIVKSNRCSNLECWGSKAQITTYVDNKLILKKIKKANKRWAFTDSFARARVFDKKYRDKWFADWWRKDHWDYTQFGWYNSKDECYKTIYQKIYVQRYAGKTGSIEKAISKINADTPVRCFPGGTPISSRWKFRPSRFPLE